MEKKAHLILGCLLLTTYLMTSLTVPIGMSTTNALDESSSSPAAIINGLAAHTPHDPLFITSDEELENASLTGSGSLGDPYILGGWVIDANCHGILITGTTKHFIIRNCFITTDESHNALDLSDIANGTAVIVNCTLSGSDIGLTAINTHGMTIRNNTFRDNPGSANGWGVCLDNSGNNSINFNNFIDNQLKPQAHDTTGESNWSSNYWSDWSGSGVYALSGGSGAEDPNPLTEKSSFTTCEFDGTIDDYGLDENLNGVFDYLIINFSVLVTEQKDIYFYAVIIDEEDTWNRVVDFYLTVNASTTYIEARIQGQYIYDTYVNGSLVVKSARMKVPQTWEMLDSVSDLPLANPYEYDDFVQPPVLFIGVQSDCLIDTNDNGIADFLVLEATYETTVAIAVFMYLVLSKEGVYITEHSMELVLDLGLQNVTYKFPTYDLSCDGPYEVTKAHVQVNSGGYRYRRDTGGDIYTTAAYNSCDFEPFPFISAKFTYDAGLDVENDDKYEFLLIEMEITLNRSDFYQVSIDISEYQGGDNYSYIYTGRNNTYLSKGVNIVQFYCRTAHIYALQKDAMNFSITWFHLEIVVDENVREILANTHPYFYLTRLYNSSDFVGCDYSPPSPIITQWTINGNEDDYQEANYGSIVAIEVNVTNRWLSEIEVHFNDEYYFMNYTGNDHWVFYYDANRTGEVEIKVRPFDIFGSFSWSDIRCVNVKGLPGIEITDCYSANSSVKQNGLSIIITQIALLNESVSVTGVQFVIEGVSYDALWSLTNGTHDVWDAAVVFTQYGNRSIIVNALDSSGYAVSQQFYVVVVEDYVPEIIDFYALPPSIHVDGTVTFRADVKDDLEIVQVYIEVNGQSHEMNYSFGESIYETNVTFHEAGSYEAVLWAIDSAGNPSTASLTVVVDEKLVLVASWSVTPNRTILVGENITATVVVNISNVTVENITMIIGDITVPLVRKIIGNNNETWTATYEFAESGNYTVVLKVIDSKGESLLFEHRVVVMTLSQLSEQLTGTSIPASVPGFEWYLSILTLVALLSIIRKKGVFKKVFSR